jgi:hypothetical protein
MVVTSQNRVMSSNGTRLIVNDAVDYFLGTVDNNWANPLNWSLGITPSNSHTVYVFADCVMPQGSLTLKGLIITAGYTVTTLTNTNVSIVTNLEVYGTFNYGGNVTLLSTVTTFIVQGAFNFTRDATQVLGVQVSITLPPNLVVPSIQGIQNRVTLSGDLTVMGDFTPNQTVYDLGTYNFTVYGICNAVQGGITKTSPIGRTLLIGKVGSSTGRFFSTITGNPTIEIRGGIDMPANPQNSIFANTNDFTLLCTTNNQVFNIGNLNSITCTNLIADGVTITINDNNTTPIYAPGQSTYSQGLLIRGAFDGTTPNSAITINTKGVQAPMVNPSFKPMATAGTFQIVNADGNKNLGLYNYTDVVTVHSYWGTTFDYLYASAQSIQAGNPTIAFSQAVTVNKGLDIRGFIKLDMGSNNLTVLGPTYMYYANSATRYTTLTGSTGGSWLFAGSCVLGRNNILLTNQSVNIEFRNGITTEDPTSGGTAGYDLGTGVIKFTTNDQVFNPNGLRVTLANILVDSGITLTLQSNQQGAFSSGVGSFNITNSIEGVSSTAKLVNKAYTIWQSSAPLMSTGVLDTYSYPNVLVYNYNGSITIRSGTYWHLYITSPTTTTFNKTAAGDIVTLGDYRQTNSATVVLGNYNLTVNGIASIGAQLSKTGPGALLFIGAVSFSLNPALSPTGPTIECRGGFTYSSNNSGTWGQYVKFTTNNQAVTFTSAIAQTINFLVDSGITLTLGSSGTSSFICTGSINGVDSTSTVVNIGTLDFRAAGSIMATGKLYCDTVANKVIYNTTLGQTINVPTDGNYRDLSLIGNPSTKTVGPPGVVNVRGVYSKAVGVTLVGTITNNP